MERFNFTFLVVLNRTISLNDILPILTGKIKSVNPTEIVPVIGPLSGGFNASFSSGFLPIAKFGDYEIEAGNFSYNRDAVRGIFQVRKLDLTEADKAMEIVNTLYSVIDQSGIANSIMHNEFNISYIEQGRIMKPVNLNADKLDSMKAPAQFGIRLYEGNLDRTDIRLMPWKEIKLEPSIQIPSNLVISCVYRTIEKINQDMINGVLSDINKLKDAYSIQMKMGE